MAEFEAKVYKLTIEEHPNADVLEIARVGDYMSLVRKGQFKTGDLGVYIPEQAVLPSWLISALGLEGRLAGKAKNRVKAIKLRGVLSQGLIYPVRQVLAHQTNTGNPVDFLGLDQIWVLDYQDELGPLERRVLEGNDVTELLDITKYEPVIPTSMSGEVQKAFGLTLKYDIENIKKYPDILVTGEEVVITEKIHGTWCCFGYHPDIEGDIVTSKGLSAQGLIFKINEENLNKNLYVTTLAGTCVRDGKSGNLVAQAKRILGNVEPFFMLGEIFGPGVQDLHYGTQKAFRLFDVYVGPLVGGHYLNDQEIRQFIGDFAPVYELTRVPVLYKGPYSKQIVDELTDGEETVSSATDVIEAGGMHMREGIVITPTVERRDVEIGRVILKSVSEKYLLRRGSTTEYN